MIIATCWKFLGKYTGQIVVGAQTFENQGSRTCGMWWSPDLYLHRAYFTLFADLDFYDLSPE